jgi:radical SAM protein with 4Fe4S-binding SPASM domain
MRVKGVYISGGGEPLIWSSKKNKISDYINRLSKVSHVAVITNGIKINKDTFNSFKNIFYVLFSFFDTNFENNKKTTKMTKTNFNILLKNIKDLARYKDKNKIKRPFLGIKTVITPENYKNTMSIYRDIKRINVDYHIFRLAVDFENSMKPYINSKQYKSMMNKIKLEWKVIDEKYTNIKQIFDCDNPAIKGECWIVKKGLYCCIDANGDVYPCLYYVGDSKYCIGNIYKEKLENIWKSKKHREIIKKLNDISKRGECPSFCRFKRYNQLIEKINYFKIPNQKDYNKMHASFI